MGIGDDILSPITSFPLPDFFGGKDELARDPETRLSTLIRRHSGWQGNNLKIAQGVAMAESGGNPKASNYCCHGIFQVNFFAHRGKYGIPTDEDKAKEYLYDPRRNISIAYKIWKDAGNSWQPWEAYTNGRWKTLTGQDPMVKTPRSPLTLVPELVGAGGEAAGMVADAALGPIDELASALLDPGFYFRLGKGALGTILIVLGTGAVVFIVANKVSSGNVGKVAKTVATKKVVK